MSRYYECDNILNHCCDKYKKKCHDNKYKKKPRKKLKCNRYMEEIYSPCYGTHDVFNQYKGYQNMYPYTCSANSSDNTLILLLIIILLCNCNPCCEE